jgi:hypothetical protein
MSWLRFDRATGQINLFTGSPPAQPMAFFGPPVMAWPAHNQTTSDSNGPWPYGVYPWSHYNAHAEAGFAPGCYSTAFGCEGIHVFTVPGRPGLGVHAGRTLGQPGVAGGKTHGCIRVPDDAMQRINQTHSSDPLKLIVVK